MSSAAGPFGDELPGEQFRSSYSGVELRLTDRRVLYHGRGFQRGLSASLPLRDVTGTGIARRSVAGVEARIGIPLFLPLLGIFLSVLVEFPGPFFLATLVALGVIPFLWFAKRFAIRIATPGFTLDVPVRRDRLHAARIFLAELESARMAAGDLEPGEAARPTAQPYGAVPRESPVSTSRPATTA